jgi:hypothetical protein
LPNAIEKLMAQLTDAPPASNTSGTVHRPGEAVSGASDPETTRRP